MPQLGGLVPRQLPPGAGFGVRAAARARVSSNSAARKKLRTFLLSTVHADHFKAQCRVTGFDAFLDRPYTDVWDKRKKIHEILAENNLRPG